MNKILCSFFGAMTLLSTVPTTAVAATTPMSSFQVASRLATGKCLQPEKGVASAGAPLSAKACSTANTQKVKFLDMGGGRFKMRIGQLCVGPTKGSYANGARLQLQTCSSSPTQNWIVSDHRFFAAGQPGKVMELDANNRNNVVLRPYSDAVNQHWDFKKHGSGVTAPGPSPEAVAMRIASNAAPAKCLQPERNLVASGEKLSAKTCGPTHTQAVVLPKNSDGSIAILIDGLCVGPIGGVYTDGTRLELRKCSGQASQKWFLADGIFSAAGQPGQVMQVSVQNLNDVMLSRNFNEEYQRWILMPTTAPSELGRVMPLGDSITFGVPGIGGYRPLLEDLLVLAEFPFDFVGGQFDGPDSLNDRNHEGHPGLRIDEIASNANAWLALRAPETVLLKIGTNDVLQTYLLDEAPNRLMNLIAQIRNARPTTRIFVANLFPIADALPSPMNPNAGTDSIAFNAAIRPLIEARMQTDNQLFFVDMNTGLSASDTVDGIHPTEAAYEIMARRWFAAIGAR